MQDERYTPILIPSGLATQVTDVELAALIRAHVQKKAEYAYAGIDYDGLTSIVAPPVVAPARVRFKDPTTGQWLTGVSETKVNPNHFRVELGLKAYAPCANTSHHRPEGCACDKELTGIREGPCNLSTIGFANFVRAGHFGTTTTITDTTPTGRSVTKTLDGGVNTLQGCAGTGTTAAVIGDTNLQTQVDTPGTVTVNAVSGSSFTATYSVTAGAARAYGEVGIKSVTTTTTWSFLMTRDTFTVLNVSSGGTLAVTYTFSFS